MTESTLRALGMAFAMGWEILWPLILGFTLSAGVQVVVSHREMVRLLPDDRPATIAKALALGAASSNGLHDLAQHRLSRSCRLAGLAIPENRRPRDVAHDEWACCNGALSLGCVVNYCKAR